MLWIGITGGIASGKTTAANLLREMGFPVIDADEIAKLVVSPGSPGMKQVTQTFGQDFVRPDGNLDRRKMADLVFKNPSELQKLEMILHPLVKKETSRQRQEASSRGEKIVFYDVPLLFEKNMDEEFDAVIVVTSSLARQKDRLKSRSKMSEEEITARLKNQLPMEEKKKRGTYILENENSLEDLRRGLNKIVQELNQKA
jgi:dephospho-CoA kinase